MASKAAEPCDIEVLELLLGAGASITHKLVGKVIWRLEPEALAELLRRGPLPASHRRQKLPVHDYIDWTCPVLQLLGRSKVHCLR